MQMSALCCVTHSSLSGTMNSETGRPAEQRCPRLLDCRSRCAISAVCARAWGCSREPKEKGPGKQGGALWRPSSFSVGVSPSRRSAGRKPPRKGSVARGGDLRCCSVGLTLTEVMCCGTSAGVVSRLLTSGEVAGPAEGRAVGTRVAVLLANGFSGFRRACAAMPCAATPEGAVALPCMTRIFCPRGKKRSTGRHRDKKI